MSDIGYQRRKCSKCGEGLGFTESDPCEACSDQEEEQHSMSNTEQKLVDDFRYDQHPFEPNRQCSETKEWHDKRDEVLERRRALMPDYDERLREWLS